MAEFVYNGKVRECSLTIDKDGDTTVYSYDVKAAVREEASSETKETVAHVTFSSTARQKIQYDTPITIKAVENPKSKVFVSAIDANKVEFTYFGTPSVLCTLPREDHPYEIGQTFDIDVSVGEEKHE